MRYSATGYIETYQRFEMVNQLRLEIHQDVSLVLPTSASNDSRQYFLMTLEADSPDNGIARARHYLSEAAEWISLSLATPVPAWNLEHIQEEGSSYSTGVSIFTMDAAISRRLISGGEEEAAFLTGYAKLSSLPIELQGPLRTAISHYRNALAASDSSAKFWSLYRAVEALAGDRFQVDALLLAARPGEQVHQYEYTDRQGRARSGTATIYVRIRDAFSHSDVRLDGRPMNLTSELNRCLGEFQSIVRELIVSKIERDTE